MARSYQDLFRPVYELPATISWGVSGAAMLILQPPMWPLFATGVFGLTYLRGKQTIDLYKFRESLSSLRVEFFTVKQLVGIIKEQNSDPGIFIGRGFSWTQKHAEIARQITNRSPEEIQGPPTWLPKPIRKLIEPKNSVPVENGAVGLSWIHGLEPKDDTNLFLSLDVLVGHTLVLGTTQAGKTTFFIMVGTQVILRNEPLIVIDPKGTADLEERLRKECEKTGKKFLLFDPARPSKSVRLNVLSNFTSSAEPATRIAQFVDADGAFTAFAWKTLFRIMRGMLADQRMPTIKAAKEYVQKGVEPLLEDLLRKHFFELKGAKWDVGLNDIKVEVPRGKESQIKSPKLQKMIALFESLNLYDETISALISMVNHSKEHYSKLIQALEPILEMLGSDELGAMLSPDPLDLTDNRPIYDVAKVINENAVLYVRLNSLPNKIVGRAIGSVLLADTASALGAIYNYGVKKPGAKFKSIYFLIDEAAEVMDDQGIQILNKGAGAGARAFLATQTLADLDVILGSSAKTGQTTGNLNNLICFRLKDLDVAKWVSESFAETSARNVNISHSTGSGSSAIFTEFNSSNSRTLSEVEIPLVSKKLLLNLPSLQYFGLIGGKAMKGRLQILK